MSMMTLALAWHGRRVFEIGSDNACVGQRSWLGERPSWLLVFVLLALNGCAQNPPSTVVDETPVELTEAAEGMPGSESTVTTSAGSDKVETVVGVAQNMAASAAATDSEPEKNPTDAALDSKGPGTDTPETTGSVDIDEAVAVAAIPVTANDNEMDTATPTEEQPRLAGQWRVLTGNAATTLFSGLAPVPTETDRFASRIDCFFVAGDPQSDVAIDEFYCETDQATGRKIHKGGLAAVWYDWLDGAPESPHDMGVIRHGRGLRCAQFASVAENWVPELILCAIWLAEEDVTPIDETGYPGLTRSSILETPASAGAPRRCGFESAASRQPAYR